jgi:hypothetical protein
MRYHYGLGVGHTYAHSYASTGGIYEASLQTSDGEEAGLPRSDTDLELEEEEQYSDDDFSSEGSESSDDLDGDIDIDDEELLAMDEMYGH